MTRNRIIIGGVILVAVIAIAITALGFLPASFLGHYKDQDFRVKKGEGLNQIAESLKEQQLIRSSTAFKFYARLSGQSQILKHGLYKLNSGMSVQRLVNIFASGLFENEDIVVTIPEGSNINDIDKIFANAGMTTKGAFLNPEDVAREGYLFPDTYRFTPGTSKQEIIERLENNFDQKIQEFNYGILSRDELKKDIIIAAMLEKEVRTKEDMGLVSGIIQNRISRGMKLEIDATSGYGQCYNSFIVGKNCEVSQANIIQAIKSDSPYNTYRIKSLPIGPISNPGLQSIEAARNPTKNDYLYYLTDREGNMHYSKTGAEHTRKRRQYLGL